MVDRKYIGIICSLAVLNEVVQARTVLEHRNLEVDPAKYDYTIEWPFTIPPKGNGLAVEKPNMILFMPDQPRFDSGIFGNNVSCLFQ